MDNKQNGKRARSGNRFFYIAMAVCAVAVTGVAVATFSTPTTDIEEPTKTTNPSSSATTRTTTTTTATTTTQPTTTTKPTEAVDVAVTPADLFVLPFGNEVSNTFSGDTLVYSKTMKDWRTHNGTDFVGEIGQTIKAAADGKITAILSDPLWGDVVELQIHEKTVIRYCGAKAASDLQEGDAVKVGQEIATLTEIPCEAAETPHLHIEVLSDKQYVDPVQLIGREIKHATTVTTGKTGA